MRFHPLVLLVFGFTLISPSQAFDKPPLKVCVVSGSFEYNSDESLKPFSEFLEHECNAKVTFLSANGDWENFPGLEALDSCDVALFYTRRLRITGEQLEQVKRYCLSGKPIVALRTASHGFQNFLEFDKEVLGGNYANHFSGNVTQRVKLVPEAKDHPVLQGITEFQSFSTLYRTSPLAPDCTPLMMGSVPKEKPEPCVWTRTYKGGRVVYIGVGKAEDFENETFRRLLVNSLFWTANREVERQPLPPVSMERVKVDGTFELPLRGRIQKDDGWEETHAQVNLPFSGTAL
jgi:type 1 glutamine amidotransferase